MSGGVEPGDRDCEAAELGASVEGAATDVGGSLDVLDSIVDVETG